MLVNRRFWVALFCWWLGVVLFAVPAGLALAGWSGAPSVAYAALAIGTTVTMLGLVLLWLHCRDARLYAPEAKTLEKLGCCAAHVGGLIVVASFAWGGAIYQLSPPALQTAARVLGVNLDTSPYIIGQMFVAGFFLLAPASLLQGWAQWQSNRIWRRTNWE